MSKFLAFLCMIALVACATGCSCALQHDVALQVECDNPFGEF